MKTFCVCRTSTKPPRGTFLPQAYTDTTNVDMTLNLGTAAYMAPELSNIANFAAEFGFAFASPRTLASMMFTHSHFEFNFPAPHHQ